MYFVFVLFATLPVDKLPNGTVREIFHVSIVSKEEEGPRAAADGVCRGQKRRKQAEARPQAGPAPERLGRARLPLPPLGSSPSAPRDAMHLAVALILLAAPALPAPLPPDAERPLCVPFASPAGRWVLDAAAPTDGERARWVTVDEEAWAAGNTVSQPPSIKNEQPD